MSIEKNKFVLKRDFEIYKVIEENLNKLEHSNLIGSYILELLDDRDNFKLTYKELSGFLYYHFKDILAYEKNLYIDNEYILNLVGHFYTNNQFDFSIIEDREKKLLSTNLSTERSFDSYKISLNLNKPLKELIEEIIILKDYYNKHILKNGIKREKEREDVLSTINKLIENKIPLIDKYIDVVYIYDCLEAGYKQISITDNLFQYYYYQKNLKISEEGVKYHFKKIKSILKNIKKIIL